MAMLVSLKGVSGRCLLRRGTPLLLLVLLGACAVRAPLPVPSGAAATPAAHVGTPYEIAAAESLLTIRVYKGGAFATAGHNHIIASHALGGTLYVPAQVLKTSFEVHVPVVSFTVDESELRAAQGSADFPPQVPDSAKEGTRHNMLGAALLDAQRYPEIVLRAVHLQEMQPPRPGAALAEMQASVRDEVRVLLVPVRYERSAAVITVTGETALKQSDLGLKPFSALLGALQVQDEMHVSFRIVAHAHRTPPPAHPQNPAKE
jgi:polyisoprenoid-binding protein YceI